MWFEQQSFCTFHSSPSDFQMVFFDCKIPFNLFPISNIQRSTFNEQKIELNIKEERKRSIRNWHIPLDFFVWFLMWLEWNSQMSCVISFYCQSMVSERFISSLSNHNHTLCMSLFRILGIKKNNTTANQFLAQREIHI